MSQTELAHLELLAEVDALVDRLNRWADDAPAWLPAEKCRALVRRLTQRAGALRVRIEAPLVVATLGGSGTGKSALVNALLGAEVVRTGRARPTTTRPTLICRPGLTPDMLGIDPASVELVVQDLPALRDLVLVDCPDPDTTEEEASLSPLTSPLSPLADNLSRLRAILPKCDVLLVTATQQKYRSARVAGELAAAAPGAHLVFVQTHADQDADIRDDWRQALADDLPVPIGREVGDEGSDLPSPIGREGGGDGNDLPSPACGRGAGGEGRERAEGGGRKAKDDNLSSTHSVSSEHTALTLALSQRERGYEPHIFRVDSLQALADAHDGRQPRGEFADLLDLLTRQMAGAAAHRIRRANFLDLAADTLAACRAKIEASMPSVRETLAAVEEQRGLLARQASDRMQTELLVNRRQWENRLLGQAASRWGFSPFALVLRAYQGIGSLFAGALLYRARTPAQVALWGALEGARAWRRRAKDRQAQRGADRAAADGFDAVELRKATLILEGYAAEAGLDRRVLRSDAVAEESQRAAVRFVSRAAADLDSLIARLARRHTGWFTRLRYEAMLTAMLGLILFRLGKNFFYDSWLAAKPGPIFGLEFYVSAAFWLLLWCLLLLWGFCSRLRGGLRGEIRQLAADWNNATSAAELFAGVEAECLGVERYRRELDLLRGEVDRLQRQVNHPRPE